MFIVGLTGGIATGKSSVASIFREFGVPVIDADEIARKVVEPGKPAWLKIQNEFGSSILLDTGELDRRKLGELIFNDIKKRKKLNSITHPYIYKEIYWQTCKYLLKGHPFIIMDLPLLFETAHMLSYLHKVIVVTCEEELQLQRLMAKTSFTEDKAKLRIAAQMPLEMKVEKANFVIENSGSISNMREQTIRVINVLKASKHHWKLRFIAAVCCMTVDTLCHSLRKFVKTERKCNGPLKTRKQQNSIYSVAYRTAVKLHFYFPSSFKPYLSNFS